MSFFSNFVVKVFCNISGNGKNSYEKLDLVKKNYICGWVFYGSCKVLFQN